MAGGREASHGHGHGHGHAYRRTFGKPRVDSDSRDSDFRMTPEVYRATEAVQFIYQHLKAEEDYSTVSRDLLTMCLDSLAYICNHVCD